MTQTTFETLNVPAKKMASLTVLYVSGLTTGIAMDSGDGVPRRVPINESYTLHHAILRSAGVTHRVLPEDKEELCYVGFDYDTQLNTTAEVDKEKTYVFPDRNIITVGAERFHCAEVLFRPSFDERKTSRFHDTSVQSNMKCDVYSARSRTQMQCCQAARPCSSGSLST